MAGTAAFDPLVAGQVAAQQTLNALLAPERLARMGEQHRANPDSPGVDAVAGRLLALTDAPQPSTRLAAVRRALGTRIIVSLAKAAMSAEAGVDATTRIDQALHDWAEAQTGKRFADPADRAWALSTARLLKDRDALKALLASDKADLPIPPGMPIGDIQD